MTLSELVNNLEVLPKLVGIIKDPDTDAATLGFDHAEIGAKMLEEWRFSHEVYLPIRRSIRSEKRQKI